MCGSQALCNLKDIPDLATRRAWQARANVSTLAIVAVILAQTTALLYSEWVGIASRIACELLLPPLYAFWLFSLSQAPEALSSRFLSCKPLMLLGEWSFCWYCLHWPIMQYYGFVRMQAAGGPWMVQYWAANSSTKFGHSSCLGVDGFWRNGKVWDEDEHCATQELPISSVPLGHLRGGYSYWDVMGDPFGDLNGVDVLELWEVVAVIPIVVGCSAIAYYLVEKPLRASVYRMVAPTAAGRAASGATSSTSTT